MTCRRVVGHGEVDLAVSVTGTGPPVLWVAGLGDDRHSWQAQVDHFSGRYTCITYDNRGCGDSFTPPGPYSIEQLAADAWLIIDELASEGLVDGQCRVVGSSMGGAIAQVLTRKHPEVVHSLVLTNTWAGPDEFLTRLFDGFVELAASGQADLLARIADLFSFSPAFLERVVVPGQGSSVEGINMVGFAASSYACREHDARDLLGGVAARTLIVAGKQDILTREALSVELESLLPSAELARVDAGHMLFQEQPAVFNDLLDAFWFSPG